MRKAASATNFHGRWRPPLESAFWENLRHTLCIHSVYEHQKAKTAMGINSTLKTTPSGLLQRGIFALAS